ncbi:MAG: YcaO-like family protein, partial [Acidobacteria bacterium]|nr:YcaO-like family protein [Acidobacteriota bacterium]
NRDQAFFSGVFESIERCSLEYYNNHLPETVTASYRELKETEHVIDVPRSIGKTLSEKMSFVSSFYEEIPIRWIAGWSLVHNCKIYVPLCFIFYTDEEKDFYLNATGGLARSFHH